MRFLGFLCNSVDQAFRVPDDKKHKFANLREEILESKRVGLRTLQRFAGKAVSFSLAIPGCLLHVRTIFKVVSALTKNSQTHVQVKGVLYDEIVYWRFFRSMAGLFAVETRASPCSYLVLRHIPESVGTRFSWQGTPTGNPRLLRRLEQ